VRAFRRGPGALDRTPCSSRFLKCPNRKSKKGTKDMKRINCYSELIETNTNSWWSSLSRSLRKSGGQRPYVVIKRATAE